MGSGLPGATDVAFTPNTTADALFPRYGAHSVIVSLSTSTLELMAANRATIFTSDDAAGLRTGAVPNADSLVGASSEVSSGACTSNCAINIPKLVGASMRPNQATRRPTPPSHTNVRLAALSTLIMVALRNEEGSPSHASEAYNTEVAGTPATPATSTNRATADCELTNSAILELLPQPPSCTATAALPSGATTGADVHEAEEEEDMVATLVDDVVGLIVAVPEAELVGELDPDCVAELESAGEAVETGVTLEEGDLVGDQLAELEEEAEPEEEVVHVCVKLGEGLVVAAGELVLEPLLEAELVAVTETVPVIDGVLVPDFVLAGDAVPEAVNEPLLVDDRVCAADCVLEAVWEGVPDPDAVVLLVDVLVDVSVGVPDPDDVEDVVGVLVIVSAGVPDTDDVVDGVDVPVAVAVIVPDADDVEDCVGVLVFVCVPVLVGEGVDVTVEDRVPDCDNAPVLEGVDVPEGVELDV